ncbi:MAG: DUF47 family protein [Candidatus Lokiarchaeota archaeon]|nr:DUF47 family protein [Candidatus Lokiarchaeota archaeon]MCK4780852.1 DUF47 family protein [Candidatus Lokiarchaeota archaeon]
MNKIREEIISMLIEHSRIIYSVISDMGVFYSGWAEDYEKNKVSLDKKKSKMQLYEEDADVIKIELIQKFSEAGADLGDFVALILKMDNIINFWLEFVDVLPKIKLEGKNNKEIAKRYEKLINKIIEMVDVLKSTIKSLRDKPEIVFKNTTAIHEIENEIDTIYRQFLDYLYSNENLNIRVLLRLRDSIVLLEEGADAIHDIADLIRVLLYQ